MPSTQDEFPAIVDNESASIDIASIKLKALAPIAISDQRSPDRVQAISHALHRVLDDDSALPSTVPESVGEGQPQNARPKMTSQGEPTQELSPNFYETSYPSVRRSLHHTQRTLEEGETGHVDITSSFVPHNGQDENPESDPVDISPTQSQRPFSQFPESQRFKTPATIGRKRDYNGNTKESPTLPKAPVLRSGASAPALMGMTQAFAATQAVTSPFVDGVVNEQSDRPSPSIPLEHAPVRSTPMAFLPTSTGRPVAEPSSKYMSSKESQRKRLARMAAKCAELQESESDQEDGDPITRESRRRQAAEKQFDDMDSSPSKRAEQKKRLLVSSSPSRHPTRLSTSPTSMKRADGFSHPQRTQDPEGAEPPEPGNAAESEAETEQEDAEPHMQPSPLVVDEEDKENCEARIQVLQTGTRLHRIVAEPPAEVESSPSLRRGEPIAVANSQPSQPMPTEKTAVVSSSTSGVDFVPGTQTNGGQQTDADVYRINGNAEEPRQARPRSQIAVEEHRSADKATPSPEVPPEPPSTALVKNSSLEESTSTHNRFATAPSRPAVSTNISDSSPPIPAGRKRKYPSQASSAPLVQAKHTATPPRQRQYASQESTDFPPSFDADEALLGDDRWLVPDESPFRRKAKRRKTQASSLEISETRTTVSESTRRTRSSNRRAEPQHAISKTSSSSKPSPEQSPLQPLRRTQATRLPPKRKDVWDVESSPEQAQTPRQPSKGAQVESTHHKEQENTDRRNTRLELLTAQEQVDISKPRATAPPPADVVRSSREQSADTTSSVASHDRVVPGDPIIKPNAVFACFNGKTRAYYPATCLGVLASSTSAQLNPRYQVQWEGCEPDTIDAYGVRSLDLRLGDLVKVELPEKKIPRVAHVVKGFKDKIYGDDVSTITDIRGYKTLLVAPKQRKSLPADVNTDATREVSMSAIYLDNNMWSQMKDRIFQFRPPQLSRSAPPNAPASGFATPLERPSTPSTPGSRRRRDARSEITQAQPAPTASVSGPTNQGLFSGMIFAISYESTERKHELLDQIATNGGTVINDSFIELFEPTTLDLKPHFKDAGFTALVADKHSQKEKYMQALALGIPCLSGKWIDACVRRRGVVAEPQLRHWPPYLLAAGESDLLEGAVRSRNVAAWIASEATLEKMLAHQLKVLEGANIIFVMGKGKREAKRRSYMFLVQAMGPATVETVADLKATMELCRGPTTFEWVFVDDREVETARGMLKSVKVAGNEFIKQSLILGQLCDVE